MLDDLKAKLEGEVSRNSQISGKVRIEEGAQVTGSVIRGPAAIARGCKIIHSYIGPFTSIYYNTLIEDTEIEHSIIMDECKISGLKARIEDSLIGKNVVITKSTSKPKAYRFMLGDSSQVGTI